MKRWVPVKGHEDTHEISTNGRVRTVADKRFVAQTDTRGYRRVCLSGIPCAVHRLVYASFVAPITPGNHINHKNGIRHDNRRSNLEDITPKENIIDGFNRKYRKLPKNLRFTSYEVLKSKMEKMNIPLAFTSNAAKMCGLKGRSQFLTFAKRLNFQPCLRFSWGGMAFYTPDIEKVARVIKKWKQGQRPNK